MIPSLIRGASESGSSFKNILEDFIRKYGRNMKVIYPSCGYDYIPSSFFEDVWYFDIDKESCAFLKGNGLKVRCVDVRTLEKQSCDLLILINPVLSAKEMLSVFSPEFIVCNNLHGTADELIVMGEFEMVKRYANGYFIFQRL